LSQITYTITTIMGRTKQKDDPVDGHVSGQSNRPLSAPAHALTYAQVAEELGADALSGLSADEAKARLDTYGRNELGDAEGVQPFKIIVAQIANAMTLVILSHPYPPREQQDRADLVPRRCSSWQWPLASASARGSRAASWRPSSCSTS
jgi:hypothetical protein